MGTQFYAMDTPFFNSLGAYDFDARCEMLRALSYDATYVTIWPDAREGLGRVRHQAALADVRRLGDVKQRYGLDVAAVYVILDVAGTDEDPGNQMIMKLLDTLEGCTTVEVAIRSSDPSIQVSDPVHDQAALRWLHRLLAVAERPGLTLALYPHTRFWLERMEDAVRLCRAADHPQLRLIFCGYHWYAAGGSHLHERLAEARPYFHAANVCGSRRIEGSWHGLPATIEPLDEGELDNFVVLGALRAVGFDGMIGVQGYASGGDVYAKLKRSIAALRDIEKRLETHPHWAQLRPT